MEKISIDEFARAELKVGEIINAEEHPNASKLLVLKVSFGDEERTIVAGLKGHYEPKDLIGKKAIFVTNLEPANLRGIESNGMILAAVSSNKFKVVILTVDKDIEAGTKIS
jgi:methionine--tRNA ligase beta chain